MRIVSVLLLLFAVASVRADDQQALIDRLAIADVRSDGAGIYSRYASGRPRLVVVARYMDFYEGEILLVRLPDKARGRGTVLDRIERVNGAFGVRFMRLIDRRNVVVETAAKHSTEGFVFRVRGEKLVAIAREVADSSNTPDLDGDGVPEIVWSGYVGPSPCGPSISTGILKWNGHFYRSDGRDYVAVERAVVGLDDVPYEFAIPHTPVEPAAREYVVRLYPGRGVKRLDVRIDGETVAAGKPFVLEDGCHTFAVKTTGRSAATAWITLEARR